ncbi:MAG TPA: CAP domain-containing protein [Candidatus Doudnabacteria bacterium]|nr:CAP domain-containing protein [Candidatus Doudnabacteria bacterium]
MKNKLLAGLLLGGFLLVAVMEGMPQRAVEWIKSDNQFAGLLSKVNLPESLPGPLLGPLESVLSDLTQEGVITETNKQREQNGLVPLRTNEKLNLAAKAKLDDMFRQQYFEHESPDGKTPADVIKAAGYDFLVVGENLALGNYRNDEILVQAWMDSPGHRENILDIKFNEIGVAVGKGIYEGKEVWMAVQEFGSPLSNCPTPEPNLKIRIDGNRNRIARLEAELQAKKQEVDRNQYSSRQAYNQAVQDYNELANELNDLIESTESLVNSYNNQVSSFNECLEKNV